MDSVIVFGPDREDPLDDEPDTKDRSAVSLFGDFDSTGEFDNQLGMNLIRNQNQS